MTSSTSCPNEDKTITLTASCTFNCREPQVLINNMTLSQLMAKPNENRTGGYCKNRILMIKCYHIYDGEGKCPDLGYTDCSDDSMYHNITYAVSGEWVVGNTSDSCIYNFSCDNGIVMQGQPPYDKVTEIYILKECQSIPFPQCQDCPEHTTSRSSDISSDIDPCSILETSAYISAITPSYSYAMGELTTTTITTTSTTVTTPYFCNHSSLFPTSTLTITRTVLMSPSSTVTASPQGERLHTCTYISTYTCM